MKKFCAVLPMVALVAACNSGGNGGANNGAGQIKIVGSSTVYPFTTAVAEEFQRANPGSSVIVESTGTGGGIKLFCSGIGDQFPDAVNASRQMKASEHADCVKNGAKNVIELPVGIDGLTLIQGKNGLNLNLTVADIYKALAANPFGKPNTAQTWRDVNPSLPPIKIRVLGPPPTSGTRDSFAELILEKGCDSDPAMKALKEKDKDAHKQTCTKIREDGAFVEAGENDNLLVQKVAAAPGTLGVLGFSFLADNADKVKPVAIASVMPTDATIADLSYPGSRKMYVYFKGEHIAAKPMIKTFIEAYSKAWSKGGPLEKRGLVPLSAGDAAAATKQASALTALDASTLK
jgi:phosphate transport system substrate-binding protein